MMTNPNKARQKMYKTSLWSGIAGEAYQTAIRNSQKEVVPNDETMEKWSQAYFRDHEHRLAVDLELLRQRINPEDQILEVGSVPLFLTVALRRCDFRIKGVDVAPERFQKSIEQSGIEVVKCDVEHEQLPFQDGCFDVVVFNELFEHLRINVNFTIKEVARVLKPGGALMLSTPNLRSARGIRNFLVKGEAFACSRGIVNQYSKLESLGHMGHVREYTTAEVVSVLDEWGLTVEEVVYRTQNAVWWERLCELINPSLAQQMTLFARKRDTGSA